MEKYNCDSPSLDLSIAMLGFSSCASQLPSSGESGGSSMKELDINQVPSDDEEDETPRKKLRLTKDQSRLLEESFRLNHTLNPKEKEILAEQLRLKPRQVEVWFQNRRARSKLKHTEMECEYLKRWFGSLTEQNRRLQKEVEELRAVKVGHHRGSHSPPPSSLTMCPSCERVAASTTTSTAKLPLLRQRQTSAAWYN